MAKRLLFLTQIWPEAQASAASTRTLSLLAAFHEAGYEITVGADSRETAATEGLRDLGYACVRLAPNDATFDSWVAELQPSVTCFDRFTTEEKFSWRVRAHCPNSLRVLDTIDLHFLRLGREKALATGLGWPHVTPWAELQNLAGDSLLRELAAIYRSDLSLIVSDFEMRLLELECGLPASLLQLCRLVYSRPTAPLPQLPFSAREGFAMVGTFRHPPNEDALRYLKTHIWPGIRAQLPQAEIRVWGSHAKAHHLAQSGQGIRVEGFTDKLPEVLRQTRVNLAPLRYGAGIKGKISDGWEQGTPTVATSLAAEGMHAELDFGGLVALDPESFIASAVKLYRDQELWEQASRSGLAILEALYRPELNTSALVQRVEFMQHELEESRRRNLVGRILWQQGLRSTEYFSRWLEAKAEAKAQKSLT